MNKGGRNLATIMRQRYLRQAMQLGADLKQAVYDVLRGMIDDNIKFSRVHGRRTVHTTGKFRATYDTILEPLIQRWNDIPEAMQQIAYPGSMRVEKGSWFIGVMLDLEHPSGYACLDLYYTGILLPLWSHNSEIGRFVKANVKQKSKLKEFLKILLDSHSYTDFPLP